MKESEVCELEDVFERAQGLEEVFGVVEQLANVIDVKSQDGKAVGDDFPSPPLTEAQAKVDGGNLENAETAGKEISKVSAKYFSTNYFLSQFLNQ